jgi:1-acyl-sn-glycerol-3-phosphate acyltransferase
MSFHSAYTFVGYYITLLVFGAGGLALSLFSLFTGWLPATERTERFFQRQIHRNFAFFIGWCAFARLVHVRYHGFDRLPRGGCVLVANHPSLIDITILLARMPEALCIFKPAIRRNPVLGAAARRAGYVANDGGHEVVRQAAEKVAAGHKLIVFPEGTRTPLAEALLPLKPGFVIIAKRAGMPIQLVRIVTDATVLRKGRAWWKSQQLPAHVEVTVGPQLTVAPDADVAAVAAEIEAWFRRPAAASDTACVVAPGAFSSTPRLSPAP